MAEKKLGTDIIYQARLHWVLFLGPVVLLGIAWAISHYVHSPYKIGLSLAVLAVIWEFMVWLTYHFSFLNIKKNHIVLCSGIIVRQTVDIPMNKIESIDIRQSILGSILQYGSLVITGTGGSRQFMNVVAKPLTCRRHIESLMYDIS
ncbi:MAG: PH domain-containing protein [Gammaproteobacteria bacterium]|nr:PH domain-containing protein [Gammaproteobacteria bacterium]